MAKRGASGLNMLLGVDKPLGITSHDVVARLRRTLGERRIGHAGTLDPLASGVMVVGVGQATRLMAYATADTKRYVARVVFGRETTTDDAEGQTRRTAPVPDGALDAAWAADAMGILLDMREQLPPAYSAVQVGGVRAYDAARKGAELELASRPIEVRAAELLAVGAGEDGTAWWDLGLEVSKGTYIRSLARDLGRALGSAAYVGALRRTASGAVTLRDCAPLESIEGCAESIAPLDPVAVLGCPSVTLNEGERRAVRDGKRLSAARTDAGKAARVPEGCRVALVGLGRLYAVARRTGGALAPEAVFADGIDGVREGNEGYGGCNR